MVQHTGGKSKGELGFSETSLKAAINSLIENCYFNVGTMAMKQAICIPVLFRKKFTLHSYEKEYTSLLR